MEKARPIVAIVGSARAELLGAKETSARTACQELGKELARAGWRIAVYSGSRDFVEPDIVAGYIEVIKEINSSEPPVDGHEPIVCIFPKGSSVTFPERNDWGAYFRDEVDASEDWEVSFYHSLAGVDGVLLVGGGNSTMIAGHVGLSRGLPTVAVAGFGGSAEKVWEYLAKKLPLIEERDVRVMTQWTAKSAKDCTASLGRQYDRLVAKKAAEEQALAGMREKAAAWEKHQVEQSAYIRHWGLAVGFLGLFLTLFIIGLVIEPAGSLYTTLTVLGLCTAGGMGATVRMLWPGAPESRMLTTPVLGIVVGLVFSLLYLLPQLIGDASFLVPKAPITANPGAIRVQYISALLVAVLAGLGFEYAFDQLLKRSRERGEEISRSSP